jgi:tRNA U38,U39,U40 pseudouridine synthase TruA
VPNSFAIKICQCICRSLIQVHFLGRSHIVRVRDVFHHSESFNCVLPRNARKYRYIGPTDTPSERSTVGCFQCDQTCLHDQEYLNAGLLRLESCLIRLIVAATSLFERCFPCFCNRFIHRLPSQCVVIGNDGHFFKMGVLCLYAICAHGQGARCEQLESPVGCLVKGHVLLKTNMRTAHSMMHRKPTESIV